jgi:hypothetical protein
MINQFNKLKQVELNKLMDEYLTSRKNLSFVCCNRPWTSLLDIYHPDPWHAPMAATTVFSTPDDGRRKRPKHVE